MKTVGDIIFFLVCFVLVSLGIFVNRKLYTTIKNEEHREKGKVIQHMVKTFSLLQCFTWPCITVLTWILYGTYVVLDSIEDQAAQYGITAL